MRLNVHLRGIDLIDLELHIGSRGLYVDLSVFQPREGMATPEGGDQATTADLSATSSGSYERADGPVWDQDQSAVVKATPGFGFGKGAQC